MPGGAARTPDQRPGRPGAPPARPQVSPASAQLEAIAELDRRAGNLAEALEVDRRTFRLAPVLREWLPGETTVLTEAVQKGQIDERHLGASLRILGMVTREVEVMASDRRDPTLGPAIADADALATACYAPIATWARAENVPLRAATPACRFERTQLMVWTGFQVTSLAPIFLPEDFFRRAAWWPAVAHEVGHSFLASVRDLEPRLRSELGFGSELVGRRPLSLDGDGLTRAELARVMGGWFEELFCDVFGTLMCGPAYGRTMFEHFAATSDPREVLTVDHQGGLYDPHPPRHLRLIAAEAVLRLSGQAGEADALRRDWDARHALDDGPPDRILFPMGNGSYLAVPLQPIEAMVVDLVTRLHQGPLDALAGFGLAEIPGLGYGPHAHADVGRVRDALLAGRVPRVRDVRAVVAGAALAAIARPDLEPAVLDLARRAIPGVGSGEVRGDAYAGSAAQPGPGVRPALVGRGTVAQDAALVRDALVLRAIMTQPGNRRRGRHGPRGSGRASLRAQGRL
jgi:hypothetical protein